MTKRSFGFPPDVMFRCCCCVVRQWHKWESLWRRVEFNENTSSCINIITPSLSSIWTSLWLASVIVWQMELQVKANLSTCLCLSVINWEKKPWVAVQINYIPTTPKNNLFVKQIRFYIERIVAIATMVKKEFVNS